MATRFANILGITDLTEPRGTERTVVALVTFDLNGTAYTGGADTVQLGGGGTDGRQTTALTLAQIIQNRRRDGKTVTIAGGAAGPAGYQSVATNGPNISAQSVATSGGNVTLNLFSAAVAGSAITTTSAGWEAPMTIAVSYTAV